MLSSSNVSMAELNPLKTESPSAIYSSKNTPSRLRLGKDVDLPDMVELPMVEIKSPASPTSSSSIEISWMDEKRINMSAYEYLCRLEEAKQWLQECVNETLPSVSELGECLRNGVILARVVQKYHPEIVKKIFDAPKLQFRHSDNINYFFQFLRKIGLPENFMFELTDLYDLKNIPKVVYSLHALGHIMQKRHLGPEMKSLVGKIEFTEEEVNAMQANLDEAGLKLPVFSEVSQRVEEEVKEIDLLPDDRAFDSGAEFISPTSPAPQTLPLSPPLDATDSETKDEDAYYKENVAKIVMCQSQIRMYLSRQRYQRDRSVYLNMVPTIVKLQAVVRGYLLRKKVNAQKQFFKKNEEAIIAIQNWFKTKQHSSAYQALVSDKSCSIPVLSKFLHLLGTDDNDSTLEEDVEQLKEVVVKQIRENAQLEADVSELDIKIALLIKNRITLDELVKVTKKKEADKKSAAEKSNEEQPKSFSNLFQLDRASRARLECYQSMFYLLQTQPKYLTRLFWTTRDTASDTAKKHLETCVLTIFSYAQNIREEYLLLKLFESIIQLEMENVNSLKDFINNDPSFFKLVVHYVRGAKEKEYLKSTLRTSVTRILDCHEELDTNYVTVYKSLIKEEESSTGKKSSKKFDISFEEAKSDSNTCARVKHNRILLQGFVRSALNDIIKSLGHMPYGIRYISKLLYETLAKKFPKESKDAFLKVIGNLIYYRYMNPALVSPDAFHVIDSSVSPLARKNLTEVSKFLYSICVDKEVQEGIDIDLEYKKAATTSFFEFLTQVTKVLEPENQLSYDGFTDAAKTRKPVIYLSMDEIFSMHATLFKFKDAVCSSPEDPMLKLLDTLGEPPLFSETNQGPEIALTLTPLYAASHLQEDYESRRLFFLAKKEIIKLIRIYKNAKNLIDLLSSPTSQDDEEIFTMHKAASVPLYKSIQTLSTSGGSQTGHGDISVQELKEKVKQMLERLEAAGLVTKQDQYQSILNSIATDIRSKHARRDAVKKEKANLELTLKTLQEKHAFLKEQEKSYLEYVDACTLQFTAHSTTQTKKKRPFFAFGRQARHMREVEKKTGAIPKFGSYIYSAKELLEKGIISWIDPERIPRSVVEKLNITIASNTAGVFEVEASLGMSSGIKALDNRLAMKEQDSFRLDELLSLQFENKADICLFDNSVKGNVNLLIFLVNKRFYA